MHKGSLIDKTIGFLEKMPEDKIEEVLHFIEFLYSKYENRIFQSCIEELASKSGSFKYLENEENLYTVNDLKEKYK